MIARVWRGVVAEDRADAYVAYVDETGVADYRRAPDCRLAVILTRNLELPTTSDNDGQAVRATSRTVEVVAFSIWDSRTAIRAFVGSDIEQMVLYPEDNDFLLEPPSLMHYEVESFALTPPQ